MNTTPMRTVHVKLPNDGERLYSKYLKRWRRAFVTLALSVKLEMYPYISICPVYSIGNIYTLVMLQITSRIALSALSNMREFDVYVLFMSSGMTCC